MNNIIRYDDYAEVIIMRKDVEYRVKIDICDIDLINQYKWHINSNGYPTAHGGMKDGKRIRLRMHRLILGVHESSILVDHDDRDKLNNRRYNIEKSTQSKNVLNRNTDSTNTSGHRGIHYYERLDMWEAKICVNYKQIFLGRFKDKQTAIDKRKEAELKYLGKVL